MGHMDWFSSSFNGNAVHVQDYDPERIQTGVLDHFLPTTCIKHEHLHMTFKTIILLAVGVLDQ